MTIELPYCPLDVAKPFHDSSAMVRLLLAGRTGGKTFAGVNEGFMVALGGKLDLFGNIRIPTPNRGVFTCFSDELIEQNLIPVIEDTLPRKYVRKWNSRGIWFVNDSVIKFRTGFNPEAFRGMHNNWAFFDEAREFPNDKGYQNFMLGAKNGVMVWMSSTPKGKNWLYWNIIKKWKDGDKNYAVFLWDSYQNKYRSEETLQQILGALNGDQKLIEQELYAKIISMEGMVWDVAEEDLDCKMPASFSEVICGLDFGHDHPTVFEVFGKVDPYWALIDEVSFRQKPTSYTVAQAVKLDDKYANQVRFFCDPARPDLIQELRQTKGTDGHLLKAFPAENDVDAGISKVDTMMHNGLFRIVVGEGKLFRDQYTGYTYGPNDKPIKDNDDACDSVRYACMAAHGVSDSRIYTVKQEDLEMQRSHRNKWDLPIARQEW